MKTSGNAQTQNIPLLQLAIAQHKSGQLAQAETCYREILRTEPHHPDANHNLGLLLAMGRKQFAAGLPLLKRALTNTPQNPQYWMSYISVLVTAGQHAEAWAQLGKSHAYIPEQNFKKFAAQQALKIALSYSQNKDWPNTLNAAQQGLNYNSEDAQLWHCVGFGYLQLGCYDEACKALTRATELLDDAHMWNHLGVAQLNAGAHEAARTAFQQSIRLNPTLAAAWSNAASTENDLFEFEQAEKFAQRALELDPESEKAQLTLGMVALKNGALEQSKKLLQAAIISATKKPQTIYKPQPRPITTAKARQALLEARACFAAADIPFFLIAGTLLGIIRGGDILEFDKDMDVGIPAHIDREAALAALTVHNQFKLNNPKLASAENWNWNFSVVHIETNIALDLFFYHPDGNHLLCGLNTKPTPILSRPRKFELETLIWQDVTWQIPSPPEQYLTDFYGEEWQTPDPFFDTVISSRCQTPESQPVRCGFGYVKLYDALSSQRWRKAYGYCVQILHFGADEFIAQIQQWLLDNHSTAIHIAAPAATGTCPTP